jgi:hypothetical protein
MTAHLVDVVREHHERVSGEPAVVAGEGAADDADIGALPAQPLLPAKIDGFAATIMPRVRALVNDRSLFHLITVERMIVRWKSVPGRAPKFESEYLMASFMSGVRRCPWRRTSETTPSRIARPTAMSTGALDVGSATRLEIFSPTFVAVRSSWSLRSCAFAPKCDTSTARMRPRSSWSSRFVSACSRRSFSKARRADRVCSRESSRDVE